MVPRWGRKGLHMSKIVIVAESGCDIPAEEARRLGIVIVPMHVTMGDATIDDGDLTPAEMLEQCRQMGVHPHTSGCMPGDFGPVFDRIHDEQPEAHILYLAYSAVTTCSYESAKIAAEGRDYVTMTDTGHVTIGQGFVVTGTAAWIAAHPEATVDEARAFADDLAHRVRMGFIPGDLGYLRAGGRLSNAAFFGATLLKIKPVIELVDGKLVATKKLRGSMTSAAVGLLDLLVAQGPTDLERIFFVRATGLPPVVQQAAEARAKELGFKHISWYETGNVITSHGGAGSFGVALAAPAAGATAA